MIGRYDNVRHTEYAVCWLRAADGQRRQRLTAETVQGATLALQSVDDVHGGDGLPLGVLGVGDGITDDVLKEHFKHTASLLVDQTGDTFHATSASQTTNGGLRDTLDVITKYLPVTLGSSFSQTLSSLTATGHFLSRKSKTITKYTRHGCAHTNHANDWSIFHHRRSLIFILYAELSGRGDGAGRCAGRGEPMLVVGWLVVWATMSSTGFSVQI